MKVKQLIRKLQKFNPDAEVLINEQACSNVHDAGDVMYGWLIDDGMDAPVFIDGSEDPLLYDIDPKQEKIVCIE